LDLHGLAGKGVAASHVSRQHLRLLRQGDQYSIFVYKGTTGTQVNKTILESAQLGKRVAIHVGDRLILGGKVRLKLARQE
jgi:pSer/pThr/pTyr-binding forkhead associated (FHA) protein